MIFNFSLITDEIQIAETGMALFDCQQTSKTRNVSTENNENIERDELNTY